MNGRRANLERRLTQIFGPHSAAVARPRFRAIVGAKSPLADTAADAREKLQEGEKLTQSEYAALELMIRLTRPALLIQGGLPAPIPAGTTADLFPDWGTFRLALRPCIPSVGLIHWGSGKEITAKMNGVGTGFLVAPDVICTAGHVVEQIRKHSSATEGIVRFQWHIDSFDRETVVTLREVLAVSPVADIALLRLSQKCTATPLAVSSSKLIPASRVTVIGHPFPDSERNPDFVSPIFGETFYVKHASVGEVLAPDGKKKGLEFDHDCSTLGGNSGSPIFAFGSTDVAGVHREGYFLERNIAIQAASISEIIRQCKL